MTPTLLGKGAKDKRKTFLELKKYPTLFFFAGKKINRIPIAYEREILNKQQIKLRKIKNLTFQFLKEDLIIKNNMPSFCSYNLIGISKRVWCLEEIQAFFKNLFPNIMTISVVTNGTVFSSNRVLNLNLNNQKQQNLPLILKLTSIHFFVCLTKNINYFLYFNIKNNLNKNTFI